MREDSIAIVSLTPRFSEVCCAALSRETVSTVFAVSYAWTFGSTLKASNPLSRIALTAGAAPAADGRVRPFAGCGGSFHSRTSAGTAKCRIRNTPSKATNTVPPLGNRRATQPKNIQPITQPAALDAGRNAAHA